MHAIPPLGTKAREMFSLDHLVAISAGKEPVACENHQIRAMARASFRVAPTLRRLAFFKVNPTNDQLELVSIGRRFGIKTEWVFGPITRQTRLI